MYQAVEAQPRRRPALWWGVLLGLFALVVIGIDYGIWVFFFESRHDIVQTDDSDLHAEVVAAGHRVQAIATTVAQAAAVGAVVVPAVLYLLRVRWYGWTALAIALLMHPTIYLITRPEFALIDRWTV